MNSIKEYEAKISKLEKKVLELEEKEKKNRKERREYKKEIRRLKRRIQSLLKSRDSWKAKLKSKQTELKSLKKQIIRKGKAKGHHYSTSLISLCVLLRIVAGCSFGSIVKIIILLNNYFHLGLSKIPCKNTIQNWVSKLGLYKLNTMPKLSIGKSVSLIIDESIRLGQEKLLLILSVPFEKVKQTALRFEDVKVVYMKGAKSWTGTKISKVVKELEQKYGFKVENILSDEDSKLKKASQLLKITHVPDISHAIATCLKRVFEKTVDFQLFKKLLGSYSSKGVNQELSYLCPPKQRSKARFMNLGRVVKWANKMLERFNKLNKKEVSFFKDLPGQSSFIKKLEACLALAKAISLPFKLKGLSIQNLKEAQTKIEAVDLDNDYLVAFSKELQKYIAHYQTIMSNCEKSSIHGSTEIIESMFGKYKSKANSYALTGLTTLNLELPLYATNINSIPCDMNDALESISINKLTAWKIDNSSDNQVSKRRQFFKTDS